MEHFFANLLRSVVTDIFNMMLILSLGELKYSKRLTIMALLIVCALDTAFSAYFYIFSDFTALARFNLIIWLVIGISCRFLFADSFMKWLFNLVTVVNVFFVIVVVSYILSRPFPHPIYANTALRLILYTIFIILFKKYLYPLYRQVVDRWQYFLLIVTGIMLNFAYIIISTKNIEETMMEKQIPILLLALLMLFIYVTILWSFRHIIREYEFYAEKERLRRYEDILTTQLAAHEKFVEASKCYRHDLRHHNQIIMEYLNGGDVKGALEYLNLYDAGLTKSTIRNYCQNHTANAVLCLYAEKAEEKDILFTVKAGIPAGIAVTPPELGSILSNIFENALEACQKIKNGQRFITFTAEVVDEILKIELRNPAGIKVEIRDNIPVSTKEGGGIGTKSVLNVIERYHGMLNFKQEDDTFITQIVVPV